jgi:DNA repair protein RecO (recombination protein O)
LSQSSRGIVLSKEVFGEADLYVHFLTRDWGVVSLLAKSAKKSKRRFVGGLDLFCHDEIFVKGDPKERGLLLELSVLNSFTGLRDNLDKALTAGKVTHWAKKLSYQSMPNPAIYSLLGQTLTLIETATHDDRLELIALIFKNKLLLELGLRPRFDECAKCANPIENELLFDISSGGILCLGCSGKNHLAEYFKVEKDERAFLEHSADMRLTQVADVSFPIPKVNYLSRLLSQFASYHTHIRLP